MTTDTTTATVRASRVEGLVLVLILLTVAGFAGAASFTHVKDWTLTNSPAGTGQWFGWANAVISELVPTASALVMRRRRRTGQPIGYPMFLLISAVALSLAAQLAVAKPGFSGWLLSAVPALAFLGLTKLILSTQPATPAAPAAPTPPTTPDTTAATADSAPQPAPAATTADLPGVEVLPAVPAHLLPTARFAAVNHEQTTGRTITADELAARMSITPGTARALLHTITEPTPPPTPARVNGAAVLDGAR
jgi:hypothetical protein